VWLVWLFGRGAGSDGMAALLVLLLLVAGGVWWIAGLAQQAPRRRVRLATALLVALTVAGLGGLRGAFDASASPRAELLADWRPYDPAGVARSLADGRPVFVAFTADWCITCKLNERKVLASDPVREAFTRHDVALYVADWTRRDDAIRAELARFGRAGVPLYLAYDPKLPEAPRVLPELLAIDDVIGALAPRAAGDPPGATGARFAHAAR
jgi:thiol:disulfide interchange protein DsbD